MPERFPDCDESLSALLAALRVAAVHLRLHPAVTPESPLSADRPAGFLLHSLLGSGLRAVACAESPACSGPCAQPATCIYGRLWERRPVPGPTPLGGIERVLSPVVIQTEWGGNRTPFPIAATVHLLGQGEREARSVIAALRLTAAEGIGRARTVCRLEATVAGPGPLPSAGALAGEAIHLRLLSPLRLVRQGRELDRFEALTFFRQLALRLASWGHHLQGLPWAGPWPALEEEVNALRVTAVELEAVRARRYSATQRRAIPLRGLLGTLWLENVGPLVRALLGAGEICGVGKGVSQGLGWIRVQAE